MTNDKKRLVLIDGMNTFYRSYAVNPTLNQKGDHIGGYVGFFKTLQKICRLTSPDDIVVAWDGPGGSVRRRSINKNYKDGRKPVKRYNRVHDHVLSPEQEDQNKGWQIAQVIQLLNTTPIKQLLYKNIEADDLISYVVQSREYEGWQKVIISNDKDFMQLLDEDTVIYRPVTEKIVTRDTVIKDYNIHPRNMTMARAIVGDKSDNLPGIAGVGDKTVVKCYPELSGSSKIYFDDIFNRAANPPKKLRAFDGIHENRDLIKENYKIMQLYDPALNLNVINDMQEVLTEDEVYFAKLDWRTKQLTDDFPMDYNWGTLEANFRKIVKNLRSDDEEE